MVSSIRHVPDQRLPIWLSELLQSARLSEAGDGLHWQQSDSWHDKLSNGRLYKMLTVLDEYTREALCVAIRPKMNAGDVLDVLHRLLMKHGKPEYIRSDNGPEFIAAPLQDWLRRVGIQPMQIYPGSPWETGRDVH